MQAGQATWPGPRQPTLVVTVNEAFCIIDYLIGEDRSVTMCHGALALAGSSKPLRRMCACSSGWRPGTVGPEDAWGLRAEHPPVPNS